MSFHTLLKGAECYLGKKRTYKKKIRGKRNKAKVQFNPIALALCRRVVPELFANKVTAVQPMRAPVGLTYAMRMIYPMIPADAESFRDWIKNGGNMNEEDEKKLKFFKKKNIHIEDGIIYIDGCACPKDTKIVVKDYFDIDGEITKVDYNCGEANESYALKIIKYYDEKENSACEISLLSTWTEMVDKMDKKDLLLNTMHEFDYVAEMCRQRLSGTDG